VEEEIVSAKQAKQTFPENTITFKYILQTRKAEWHLIIRLQSSVGLPVL
jgi:hypothetical protein